MSRLLLRPENFSNPYTSANFEVILSCVVVAFVLYAFSLPNPGT